MIEEWARAPLESLTGDQFAYYREQARLCGALAVREPGKGLAMRSPQPKAEGGHEALYRLLCLIIEALRKVEIVDCKMSEREASRERRNVKPSRVLDESKFRSGYWPGGEG